jgi:hypothetical protein
LPPLPRQYLAQKLTTESGRQLRSTIVELIETERTYVSTLQLLVTFFATPILKDGAVPAIPANDRHVMFGQLDALLKMHLALLKTLTPWIPADKNTHSDGDVSDNATIDQSFAQGLVDIGHMLHNNWAYRSYAIEHSAAQGLIEHYTRSNIAFAAFRAVGEEATERKLGLPAMMLEPIQRPPRYLLLLGQIIKFAATVSKEEGAMCGVSKDRLHETYNMVERGLIFVNEAVKRQESAEQLIDIQARLIGGGNDAAVPCLLCPGRELISMHDVVVRTATLSRIDNHKRTMIICNNVIMLVEPHGPKRPWFPTLSMFTSKDVSTSPVLKFVAAYYNTEKIGVRVTRTVDESFVIVRCTGHSNLMVKGMSPTGTTTLYTALERAAKHLRYFPAKV